MREITIDCRRRSAQESDCLTCQGEQLSIPQYIPHGSNFLAQPPFCQFAQSVVEYFKNIGVDPNQHWSEIRRFIVRSALGCDDFKYGFSFNYSPSVERGSKIKRLINQEVVRLQQEITTVARRQYEGLGNYIRDHQVRYRVSDTYEQKYPDDRSPTYAYWLMEKEKSKNKGSLIGLEMETGKMGYNRDIPPELSSLRKNSNDISKFFHIVKSEALR